MVEESVGGTHHVAKILAILIAFGTIDVTARTAFGLGPPSNLSMALTIVGVAIVLSAVAGFALKGLRARWLDG